MKLILPAPTELNDIESADLCHFDDYKWFRDGEDVMQFIEDFLQTRREIADNIQQILEFRLYHFGLETVFAQGPSYAECRQVSTGSEYIKKREQATFLSMFIRRIVDPVQLETSAISRLRL